MIKKLFVSVSVLIFFGLTFTSTAFAVATPWSDLTDPAADLSLSTGAFTTTLTAGSATTGNLLNLQDTTGNTGTGFLLNLATASGSAASPLQVSAGGSNGLMINAVGNLGIGTTTQTAKTEIISNANDQTSLRLNPFSPTQTAPGILLSRLDTTGVGINHGADSLALDLQVNTHLDTPGAIRLQAIHQRPYNDEAKFRISTGGGTKIADFYTQTSVQSTFDLYDAVTGNVGLKLVAQSGSGGGIGSKLTATGAVLMLGSNNVDGNILTANTIGTGNLHFTVAAPFGAGTLVARNTNQATSVLFNGQDFNTGATRISITNTYGGDSAAINLFNSVGTQTALISATTNSYLNGGKVGIGTTTPQGILDVSSTTSGFLPPRMTQTQRDAIASPVEGMVIYNLTAHKLNVYTGTWETITSN